jgi:hypothetical protein
MFRSSMLFAVLSFAVVACGGQTNEPAATPPLPPAEEPGAKPLTSEECQAQSGEVLHDGCPSGRTQIGMVGPGGEGGVCCSAPGGGAPVEQPTGKRSPCTVGADQTCNEDPKVSALWGKCTDTGVCVCNPGFQLGPGGYCRPAS